MSLVLVKNEIIDDALDRIFGFFEGVAQGELVNSLQELYDRGYLPRSQDQLMWYLGRLIIIDNPTLTLPLIQDIYAASNQLQANNDYPDDYPPYVKEAFLDLSTQIEIQYRPILSRAQGRNLRAAVLAGIVNSPATREIRSRRAEPPPETAFNTLRGTPAITDQLLRLLSGAPRAGPQSEGTIGPAMRNLRRMAKGKDPFRLFSGRGTRIAPENRTAHRAGPRSGPGRGSRRGGRRTRRKRA